VPDGWWRRKERAKSGNHATQQIPSSARPIGVIGIVGFATSINLPPNTGFDTASRRKLNIQGVISEPQASPMNDDRRSATILNKGQSRLILRQKVAGGTARTISVLG
jgi:hypothetical protein